MKKLILIGHLTYLLLFILAGIFYLERILYTDSAFYLFKMIHSNSFNIELGRYTSVIYEFFAYVFMKMGLPLKYLLFSFSVSVIIFSYIAFIVTLYILKHEACAFTILFLNFMGVASSFFYPISELNIGLIFCIILFALLEKKKESFFDITTIIIGILLIYLSFLSHPGVIPVIIFLLGYFVIRNQEWKNFNVYIFFTFFLFLAVKKTFEVQQNAYEANVMSNLSGFIDFFKNITSVYSIKFYFLKNKWMYGVTNIIFLFTCICLLRRRKYLEGAFYVLSFGGLLLFYLILYQKGDADVMMEKALIPLTVFMMLPFLNEVIFRTSKKEFYKIILLSSIILYGFIRFINISPVYTERIAYLDKKLAETNHAKNIYYYHQDSIEQYNFSWAIGIETLMYSTIKDSKNPKTIYFQNINEPINDSILNKPQLFMCVPFWPKWEINDNCKRYFNLPESSYIVMNP